MSLTELRNVSVVTIMYVFKYDRRGRGTPSLSQVVTTTKTSVGHPECPSFHTYPPTQDSRSYRVPPVLKEAGGVTLPRTCTSSELKGGRGREQRFDVCPSRGRPWTTVSASTLISQRFLLPFRYRNSYCVFVSRKEVVVDVCGLLPASSLFSSTRVRLLSMSVRRTLVRTA